VPSYRRAELCREILQGFGDVSLGEWIEDRPIAFHIRRRLAVDEAKDIGEPIDFRGTEEGPKRLKEIAAFLPVYAIEMANDELKGAP